MVVRRQTPRRLSQSHDFDFGFAKQTRLIVHIGIAASRQGLHAGAEQRYARDVKL